MSLRFNGNNITKAYFGNNEIKKIYLNSVAVYDQTGGSPAVTLPASTVFNLEASNTDSYDGSTDLQLFKNAEVSPADGSSQSDNNATFGATTGSSPDDPTFNGTPGVAGAYMSTDGANHFQFLTRTDFVKGIHRSDTGDFQIVIPFRVANLSSLQRLMANANISSSHYGFALQVETDGSIAYERRKADNSLTSDTILSSSSISADTDYLLIFEVDKSTGNYSTYLNSKTATNSGTLSAFTSTTDSNNDLYLMRHPSSTTASMNSGGRLYACMLANTTGNISDIVDYYNASTGITFA